MSEDGPTPFEAAQALHPNALTITADSAATAQLIQAAGWPASAALGDRPVAGLIHAFDWQVAVPDKAALADLPSDTGLLCLVSLETIDRADMLLINRTARCVFGQAPFLIATELSDLAAVLLAGRAFDPNRDERARLQAMAAELARLAEQLGAISAGDADPESPARLGERNMGYEAETPADRGFTAPPDPQRIRHLINLRRMRGRFFAPELFADPAWDILLDLAAARLEGRAVSVSSLCIAAAVPPTTALRWIRLMTDQQLLVRQADPQDARRMFMALSDAAFDQLCGWFALADARGGLGG